MLKKIRYRLFGYSILGMLILWSAPVNGQPESGVRLTLEAALEQALQNSPELKVIRKELGVARGVLTQAQIYPFNPALELEGGGGRAEGVEEPVERRTVGGFVVGLSQVIETKGQRAIRTDIASAILEQTESQIRDAERRILADVMRAFGDVLETQERLKLAEEAVALAEDTRETARKQFEAGEVPRLDLLRAEVELRRASTRQVAEKRRIATVRKNLNLRLGRAPDAPLRAEGPLLFVEPSGTKAELLKQALELRPDLKAAEAGLQTSRRRVRLVRAERLFPEVEVALRYEDSRDFEERDRRVMLDFAIPLPLFNRRQGELEAALAEELRQDAEIVLVQARIETEVAIAFEQFEGSQQIVDQYVQRILPQQEQNFRLLREGYTLGQFGLTDVLLAQRELIDVRFDYLEAIGEFNTAVAELRQALGLVTFSTTSQTSVSGPKTAGYLVGISNSRKKGYQP